MPSSCAAINCTNRQSVFSDVSFFNFPKDKGLRKKWIHNLKRANYEPGPGAKICSAHFDDNCFERRSSLQEELGMYPKRRLVKDAVPTRFSFNLNFKVEGVEDEKKRGAVEKRRQQVLSTDSSVSDMPIPSKKKVKRKCMAEEIPTLPAFQNTECQTEMARDLSVRPPKETFNVALQTKPREIRHFKVQIGPKTSAKECQTDGTNMIDAAVQCNLPVLNTRPEDEDFEDEDEIVDEEDEDVWLPDDEVEEEFESDKAVEGNVLRSDVHPFEERKFMVFESCLLQLLAVCTTCFMPCTVVIDRVVGSLVALKAVCQNGHRRYWSSQPMHRGMPYGNILTAAATLFSGSSPATVLRFFHHLKVNMISIRTYFKLQTSYLCPAVSEIWTKESLFLLRERKSKPVRLGGDGRCCSPGHTAKYGSYTLMDLEDSKVIVTELVQSNEVKNSSAMELEGLKRCLNELAGQAVEVDELVTDRHTQVKKYMREQQQGVKHHFDVWHMAKGIKKKLDLIGKKNGLEVVGRWARSISNHLYWCAASSGGEEALVEEKWLSVLNHICDIHEHEGQLFKKCKHGDLEEKEWLTPGSRALKNIEEAITPKAFLKDVRKVAPNEQTSSLESFHNVVCMFASKHGHYFFEAMECRLRLAALHFNENSCRQHAVTKGGQLQYRIIYGKANQGTPVVKEVKTPITYGYVNRLMQAVCAIRQAFPSYTRALCNKSVRYVEPVSNKFDKQDKMVVVENRIRRFNRDK